MRENLLVLFTSLNLNEICCKQYSENDHMTSVFAIYKYRAWIARKIVPVSKLWLNLKNPMCAKIKSPLKFRHTVIILLL